jgi:hypothetical protein
MSRNQASISRASLALLAVQLVLVSATAGTYLYQRWAYPRVWARAAAVDPELPMRGRYLSLPLTVDGCQSTLPLASQATFPRDINGAIISGPFFLGHPLPVSFRADLKVEHDKLLAIRISDEDQRPSGQMVSAWPGSSCAEMRLDTPVDFYIAEKAAAPLPLKPGQELWMEVTVPPKGPPRPLQLALKQDGAWKPLAFQ